MLRQTVPNKVTVFFQTFCHFLSVNLLLLSHRMCTHVTVNNVYPSSLFQLTLVPLTETPADCFITSLVELLFQMYLHYQLLFGILHLRDE